MRFSLIPAALGMALLLLGCPDRKSEPVGSSSQPTPESKPASPRDATAPATKAPPPVPPLLPGETAPVHGPNYFEPGEMGSTGIATAYQSCMDSLDQTKANMPTWEAVPYCSCLVDTWRANIHTAGSADLGQKPTPDQIRTCTDLDGSAGPLAIPFPKDSPDLYNSWKTCIEKFASLDHGVYCGCYTDGVFKNPQFLTIAPADDKRCIIADEYYAATKKHLTVRQFQGLVGPLLGDVPDAGHSLLPPRGR
jgi:hypothetical protein